MKQVIMLLGRLMTWLYMHTGDYGIAIVCLTVFVKFCLLPFQVLQRRKVDVQRAGTGGCLMLLLTLPVLTGLYRTVLAVPGTAAVSRLCPWIASLLARDPYGILPAMSAIVQLIPQSYSYLSFFRKLNLPKTSKGRMLSSAVMTLLICLPLPSAVGIYYLTSGIFSALEQAVWNGVRAYRLRMV